MSGTEKERIENELAEALEKGEMKRTDEERSIRERLSPKYEVRIQTQQDPIVEETLEYRKLASEVDGRYDDYLKRAGRGSAGSKDEETENH